MSLERNGRSSSNACLNLLVFVILLLLISCPVVVTRSERRIRRPHRPWDPNEVALGLYLAPSYVTAAVAFPNGSIENIGKAEANEGPGERFRQWKRSVRRKLGLPSSSDVGKLSTPLRSIAAVATQRLGYRPQSVLLVTTAIRALYDEDINDIMEYLGFRQAPLRHLPWLRAGCESPHELAAAYAGHGFGLCEHCQNATLCDQEEQQMPFEHLIGISLSRTGIAMSQAGMRAAYVGDSYDETMSDAIAFKGFGGDDRLHNGANDYWDLVAKQLKCRLPHSSRWNVSRVMLYDESVDRETEDGYTLGDEAETVIRGLMRETQGEVEVLKNESLYVTAIGAARLALRGRYVPEGQGQAASHESDLRKRNPDPLGCPWYAADLADMEYC